MAKYMTIILLLLGCMPIESNYGDDYRDNLALYDRTVYRELSSDDILSIVAENWDSKVSDYCLGAAAKISITYTDDILDDCKGASDSACIYEIDLKIFISADDGILEQYESVAHEFIHFLALCVDGDRDRYHKKGKYWALIDNVSSIEALSKRDVFEDTRVDRCASASSSQR